MIFVSIVMAYGVWYLDVTMYFVGILMRVHYEGVQWLILGSDKICGYSYAIAL
jgi:hypothetical protein